MKTFVSPHIILEEIKKAEYHYLRICENEVWENVDYIDIKIVNINRGNGSEEALIIKGVKDHDFTICFQPFSFEIQNEKTCFRFYVQSSIYFENII